MEYHFSVDYAGIDKNVYASLAIMIAGLVGIGYLYFKKSIAHNYRLLGMMLLGFTAVIAFAVAFFSLWTMKKLDDIKITPSIFSNSHVEIPIQKIERYYIKMDQPDKGMFQVSPNQGVHYLILEAEDHMNIILSEINYPIREIKEALDLTMSKE